MSDDEVLTAAKARVQAGRPTNSRLKPAVLCWLVIFINALDMGRSRFYRYFDTVALIVGTIWLGIEVVCWIKHRRRSEET
ncbi:hypothetical protein AB0K74_49145 [Streptomyces sp. NPDC056159]|uniref:hypothetical protein n=1 Tax=Streptomyces sp. NPDC056159 TaxID=3155537 RepID=UPI00341D9F60